MKAKQIAKIVINGSDGKWGWCFYRLRGIRFKVTGHCTYISSYQAIDDAIRVAKKIGFDDGRVDRINPEE